METITGIISEKGMKSGVGPTGVKWTRAEFVINGQKYSTFDRKIIDSFDIEQNVTMTGELGQPTASGKSYWNMNTMVLATEMPKEQPIVAQSAPKQREETFPAILDTLRQILAELRK